MGTVGVVFDFVFGTVDVDKVIETGVELDWYSVVKTKGVDKIEIDVVIVDGTEGVIFNNIVKVVPKVERITVEFGKVLRTGDEFDLYVDEASRVEVAKTVVTVDVTEDVLVDIRIIAVGTIVVIVEHAEILVNCNAVVVDESVLVIGNIVVGTVVVIVDVTKGVLSTIRMFVVGTVVVTVDATKGMLVNRNGIVGTVAATVDVSESVLVIGIIVVGTVVVKVDVTKSVLVIAIIVVGTVVVRVDVTAGVLVVRIVVVVIVVRVKVVSTTVVVVVGVDVTS